MIKHSQTYGGICLRLKKKSEVDQTADIIKGLVISTVVDITSVSIKLWWIMPPLKK